MDLLSKREGCIPKILDIDGKSYGDYLTLNIDKNGYIKDWKVNHSLLEELLEN